MVMPTLWEMIKGLLTSGSIKEMHTALLKADCTQIDKVESHYHQLCDITSCIYNSNDHRCTYKLKCIEEI